MEVSGDDSLAGGVSEYVESIMKTAERDAAAIRDESERDCECALAEARAEVGHSLTAASRELAGVAADRIARLLELRRAIDSKAALLPRTVDGGGSARRELAALSDTLAERADEIAREARLWNEGEGAPAIAPTPPAPAARAAQSPRESAPPTVTRRAPAYDEAHLHALRRAVAGATRGELEPEIEGMLASHDGACTVLDDVFGSTDGPFGKWTAAQRATEP